MKYTNYKKKIERKKNKRNKKNLILELAEKLCLQSFLKIYMTLA